MDFSQAKAKRDKRLRRQLLMVIYLAAGHHASGYVHARFVVDQAASVAGRGQGFEDDAHALQLLRELKTFGMVEEREIKGRRVGQKFGLDWVEYCLTDKGAQTHLQAIDPHPLIEDDRQLDE
jgi:non-canonical (house-cleaning) NTP pyrophosphatase